jgi:[CysO sulfur-carrier protein]-S-L-cysteine hydrolase
MHDTAAVAGSAVVSDLATVVVYTTRSDAEIARARLESDGIHAVVMVDDEGGLNPGFYSRYGVRVVVGEGDLADARQSLGIAVVTVPGEALQVMVDHARHSAPNEGCGLLAGADGLVTKVYTTANAHAAPDHFTIDPAEQFRVWRDASAGGWDIVGSFHSHPAGLPIPSQADLDGGTDPAWVNLIVGIENGGIAVRAYRYVDGIASPVVIEHR